MFVYQPKITIHGIIISPMNHQEVNIQTKINKNDKPNIS